MVPFRNVVRCFLVYRKYLGRRLYIVFALTFVVAMTEGLGIALLLPLLVLVGVKDAPGGDPNTAATIDQVSALGRLVQDVLARLGIGDSMPGILLFISSVFVVKGVIKFGEGAYKSHLQAQLKQVAQERLFDAYATMDYRYYTRHSAGHFVNLLTQQIFSLMMSFENYKKFVSGMITVATYFAFAFLISWPFATMAAIAGLAIVLVLSRLTQYVHRLSRLTAEEYGTLDHFLVQTMHAFKYLAATSQMAPLRTAVVKSIGRLTGYLRKRDIAQRFTESVQEPLAVLILVAIIVVQVALLDQAVTPVLVGLVLIYRAMQHVVAVQSNWQATMQEMGSLEMVEEEFERVGKNQQVTGTTTLRPLARGIELTGVSFAYDPAHGNVLEDMTLTIPANYTVALVGESGAGKSTLVDLLTLVLRPGSGMLTIDGVSHEEIEVNSWREQIGYVSQDAVVFDDTIANNICLWRGEYAADPDVRYRVELAAERAGARRFIDELPDGFKTGVGDRGVRLSGGQRQRLFIARELYKNPRLLILDEATSALDSETELVVKESVDQLKGSTTVVIIAHRLSTIRNADYIYVLDKGRIVEEGTYDGLVLDREGAFNRMVALQRV